MANVLYVMNKEQKRTCISHSTVQAGKQARSKLAHTMCPIYSFEKLNK